MELSEHPLFGRLTEEELGRLEDLVQERDLVPAEALFREGAEGDDFYLLLEGQVRLSCTRPDGGQERLGLLKPGAVLGVTGLESTRPSTAAAMGPTRVMVIPGSALHGTPRTADGRLALGLREIVALAQNYQLRSANRQLAVMAQQLRDEPDTDAWTDVGTQGGWVSDE